MAEDKVQKIREKETGQEIGAKIQISKLRCRISNPRRFLMFFVAVLQQNPVLLL